MAVSMLTYTNTAACKINDNNFDNMRTWMLYISQESTYYCDTSIAKFTFLQLVIWRQIEDIVHIILKYTEGNLCLMITRV
jgi:hypothetical protein